MPHYEYFDIPGMGLARPPDLSLSHRHAVLLRCRTAGEKQILSEAFAMCGHNVGHDELKRNYEWMMVRGINLLCQHLEGYSLRGIRKRDYPPAMYTQQPWWEDYKIFNDAMSRIGMLLAEGELEADTLLIHPQTTAWILFDTVNFREITGYNRSLLDLMDMLEQKHIPYHLGDEILMERHAYVENGALVIGNMRYTKIILPPHIAFLENTEQLLSEFTASGGQILAADELETNSIVDSPCITYTKRKFANDGFTMHYFVNSTDNEIACEFTCGGKVMDPVTGELSPFDGTYVFPKWGSLVLIDDGMPAIPKKKAKEIPRLPLEGAWRVIHTTENALVLDKCTYYFDGALEEENGYILNVGNRTLKKECPVDILCRFTVQADYISETMFLVSETPEYFDINAIRIQVNGTQPATMMWAPYEADLTPYLHEDENSIRLTLVNNLRNLLGPHHHKDGELVSVAPQHFFVEPCIWTNLKDGEYTERYCFVKTGVV